MNKPIDEVPVGLEVDNGVALVRLNQRETRNVLGLGMLKALDDAFRCVEDSQNVRVAILASASQYFCAGADLKMVAERMHAPYELFRVHDRLVELTNRIERLRVPVIAAISGVAIGGGVELALACDLRFIEESATLCLPEVHLGILPGAGGIARLARIVGREKALYYALTGDKISAAEAESMGLVMRVVPTGRAVAEAQALARRVVEAAPVAVEIAKRALRLSLEMPLHAAVDHCQFSALLLGGTHDAREGVAAFLAKRNPVWTGG